MVGFAVLAAIAVAVSSAAMADNIRGAATRPTTGKGYDHPDQSIHMYEYAEITAVACAQSVPLDESSGGLGADTRRRTDRS